MNQIILKMGLAVTLVTTQASAVEVSMENKISSLYISFFNRAADESGLTYWNGLGEDAEARGEDPLNVLKQLSAGFATHPTFTSTYSSMGNEAFVQAIYQNSLGREGDAGGVAYWTDLLDNGKSRSDMVAEFMNLSLTLDLIPENFPTLSAEDLAAAVERQNLISNKVEVAVYFTKSLGTLTNVAAENAGDPTNDPSYLASIQVISDVGIDIESVTNARGKIYGLAGNSNAVNAINNTWDNLDVVEASDPNAFTINTISDIKGYTISSNVAYPGTTGSTMHTAVTFNCNDTVDYVITFDYSGTNYTDNQHGTFSLDDTFEPYTLRWSTIDEDGEASGDSIRLGVNNQIILGSTCWSSIGTAGACSNDHYVASITGSRCN